jgi:aerobic-type carbon monoxide dehydrogenase small subunit (CoxS/CutS family)
MTAGPDVTAGPADGPGTELTVTLQVDGTTRTVVVDARTTLLSVLRDELGITSARGTCGIGVCGSCTVLVDDKATSSCIMLAAQARDREVTTCEGLRLPSGELSAVQQAFVDRGAYQCSFCIPAMVLTVHAALQDPEAGRDVASVREYLAGNLCRCGTYPTILEAVSDLVGKAAAQRADGGTA